MNSGTDRSFRESGGNDPDQRLERLLAEHRTLLTDAVANALDTGTGSTALAPLRRESFHGLKPLKLAAAPTARTANSSTSAPALPPPGPRLHEALARLRDIKLMVEKVRADEGMPLDGHARAHTVLTALQHLHAGLEAGSVAHDQVRALFKELKEQAAHIGTLMLGPRTQLPRHVVEQWLRAAGTLDRIERIVLRLLRDADVPTQG